MNNTDRRSNTHPGEFLEREFLDKLGISSFKLAADIRVPQPVIAKIMNGKRELNADLAIRLGRYFGNSPDFWLGLQKDFDIEAALHSKGAEYDAIQPYSGIGKA